MKSHILIIEDNEEIRENITEILSLPITVFPMAENGKIGIEKAQTDKPDLIICDVMMPVLDGYGVLHLIHKNDDLAGIPFIFLTAKSERSDFRKGMEMGADDYHQAIHRHRAPYAPLKAGSRKCPCLKELHAAGIEGMQDMLNEFGKRDARKHFREPAREHPQEKQMIYTCRATTRRNSLSRRAKVKTYISNDDGKDLTVGLYSDGDFFGYTALLEGTTYKETAEAIDESLVAEIPISTSNTSCFPKRRPRDNSSGCWQAYQ